MVVFGCRIEKKKRKEQTSVIKESCGGYKEKEIRKRHLFPWAGERLERLILYFISAVGKPKLPLVYHQGFGAVVPAAPP